MKTKLVLSLILSLALLVLASPVYAGIPALPHAFYGSVTINDDPAPDGTKISATTSQGSVVAVQNPVGTSGGSYGSPYLLVQGDIPKGATVIFYVNGIEVEGATAPFEVGGGPTEMKLDLVSDVTAQEVVTVPAGQTGYIDFSTEAGTTITVNTKTDKGDVTVTVQKYADNPHPPPPGEDMPADMLPRYIDIKVDNADAIDWPMYVEQSYTHAEIEGFDEDSLRMYYFKKDDNVWRPCEDTDVNPEEDYIWAKMTRDEVSGSPIAIGGTAAPEPTPAAGGGGIGPRRVPPGTTNVRGEVSWEGVFEESVTAFSDDELCTLTIPEGTVGLTEDLEPLDEITILREDDPPEPPEEADIVLAYDLGPDGATFEPAVTLTFSYDPDDIPEGKDVLVVAYYDEIAEAWVYLEGEVDTVTKTITVSISHFTTFAIIARAAPPAPAAFSVTNLSVKPLEVEPKEVVTISLSVANTGGTEGSYTVVLKINDVKEADKSVTIAAGKSQDVSFSVAKEKAGSYSVVVDGLSASFTVVAPVPEEEVAPPEEEEVVVPEAPVEVPPAINWPVLGLIIAAVVVAGVLIFLLVRRKAY